MLIMRIGKSNLHNILVDLVAAINVMTKEVMDNLGIKHLRTTYTLFKLVDISLIRP